MLNKKLLDLEKVLRTEMEAEYISKESKMRALLTETLELEKHKHTKEVFAVENKYKEEIRDQLTIHKREMLEQQAVFDKELVEEKSKLSAEFYGHLGDELKKLHSEGNFQTKFVKDLAIEMMGNTKKKEITLEGDADASKTSIEV